MSLCSATLKAGSGQIR